MKRVKDTLKAFQSKFEYKLKLLRDEFEEKIRKAKEYNREQFKIADERLDKIETSINEEVKARFVETDEQVHAVKTELTGL